MDPGENFSDLPISNPIGIYCACDLDEGTEAGGGRIGGEGQGE